MRYRHPIGPHVRWLLAATMLALTARQGHAISISFTIDNPQNHPAYDPDGANLAAIAQAAATIWESLRPGNETYHWNIHWEDFEDGNTLAVANSFDGSIRFKTNHSWFLDATPLENEEFQPFSSSYVDGLSSGEKDLWFVNTDPPDELEYGYHAGAITGGAADGLTDLLTVMLHEMGHLSGITYNDFAPDVPIPSQWIGFRTGVKVKREDDGHIIPDESLMDPFIEGGRTLPSALDVLVNAHEKGADEVHLARVDFAGNELVPAEKSWHFPLNWIGGEIPDATQQVRISSDHEIYALADAAAKSLRLTGKLQLLADLDVNGELALTSSGELTVGSSSSVDVGDALKVSSSSAQLSLDGGAVAANRIDLSNGGVVSGYGTLAFDEQFDNGGTTRASGGLLEFSTSASADYDLDGFNELGNVLATDGDISFGAGSFEEFNGEMRIEEGHYIEFNGGGVDLWIGNNADIHFQDGGSSSAASLRATSPQGLNLDGGTLTVEQDTSALIDFAWIRFIDDQVIQVEQQATLELRGATEYYAGTQQGAGELIQNGPVTVSGNTTLDFHRYDMDGTDDDNTIEVAENQTFTINAGSIDSDNRFQGSIHLRDKATLDLNVEDGLAPLWNLKGELTMHAGSSLKGSLLRNEGLIDVQKGTASIETTVALQPGAQIVLQGLPESDVVLNMTGPSMLYQGGHVTTSSGVPDYSQFHTFGTSSVSQDTTIVAGYFNWDASDTTDSYTYIDEQKTLAIRTGKIGTPDAGSVPGNEGFGDTIDVASGILDVLVGSDSHGALDLPNYWSIKQEGTLNLNHTHHDVPSVKGSRLVNHGTISGTGRFLNRVDNLSSMFVGHDQSIGLLDFFDELHLGDKAATYFELAGSGAGQFDQVRSDSEVWLDGDLHVELFGGFLPAAGDTFRLFDATAGGKVTGDFQQSLLPNLPGNWDLIVGDDFVDLRFNAVPEPSSLALGAVATLILVPVLHRRRARRRIGPA